MGTFHITAAWDDEAGCWVVLDSDVPGLVTEAETWSEFVASIRDLVPLLLLENERIPKGHPGEVPVEVMARQVEQVRLGS